MTRTEEETEKTAMEVNCVIALHSFGLPGFASVTVLCSKRQYKVGAHYKAAKDWAKEEKGYDDPMVVFDAFDGPNWLFKMFPPDDDVVQI